MALVAVMAAQTLVEVVMLETVEMVEIGVKQDKMQPMVMMAQTETVEMELQVLMAH